MKVEMTVTQREIGGRLDGIREGTRGLVSSNRKGGPLKKQQVEWGQNLLGRRNLLPKVKVREWREARS